MPLRCFSLFLGLSAETKCGTSWGETKEKSCFARENSPVEIIKIIKTGFTASLRRYALHEQDKISGK